MTAKLVAGLGAWAALILLQILWHAWLLPPQRAPLLLVLAIALLPLLLPLLALTKPQRALLWVGIVSLFYFCHGIAEAWSAPHERMLALIEVILSVALIASLGWGMRRRDSPAH